MWPHVGRYIIGSMPTSAVSGTPVSSEAELRSAFASGAAHVHIVSSFTISSQVNLPPRNLTMTANVGAIIKHTGGMYKALYGHGGGTRTITINGLTFDGGWNDNPSEAPNDTYSPIQVEAYARVEVRNSRIQYSRRAGLYCTDNAVVLIDGCSFYAIVRDGTWANGTVDFTVQNCTFDYLRDDAGSCHVPPGMTLSGRRVRFVNNTLFQAFEVKFLGGGDVLIENNTMDVMGPAAILLGIDPTTGEGNVQPHTGYVIRNNTIRHPISTSAMGWSGDIRAIEVYAPGKNTGVLIENNTFVALPSAPTTISALYPDRPNRLFDKNGWIDPAPVLPPEREGVRFYCANAWDTNANIFRNNTFSGTWNYQFVRVIG